MFNTSISFLFLNKYIKRLTMRKKVDKNIKQIKSYIIYYSIFNIFKIIVYVASAIYLLDFKIKYWNISHVEGMDISYIIMLFLLMLLFNTISTLLEMKRLIKLVNDYQLTDNFKQRTKCCYKIMGYLGIYNIFIFRKNIKECEQNVV